MSALPQSTHLSPALSPAEAGAADEWGAFLPGPRAERPATGDGPLSGLRFAVQDMLDVEGAVTGAGNRDWAHGARPAAADAAAVAACRAAGAALAGKTVTDELGFSLEGANPEYGAPVNPRDPGALCGGAASGAAAAVAAGLVDFALGVDSGGSVRIPGALCGLWAFRPSHGRVSAEGALAFAKSYDAISWLAPGPEVLERVAAALLGEDDGGVPVSDIRLVSDAVEICEPACAEALAARCGGWTTGAPLEAFPGGWRDHFRVYAYGQAMDLCDGLGREVERRNPKLGEASAQRLAAAMAVERSVGQAWEAFRRAARNWLLLQTPPGRALLIPTSPQPRLPRDVQAAQMDLFYARGLPLTAIAGAAGAPQIQMPLAAGGVSLIGRPGHDRALIDAALKLAAEPY